MSKEESIEDLILRLQSRQGGWSRADLERLGVSWPPKKGWKKRLLAKERKRLVAREAPTKKKKNKSIGKTKATGFYQSWEWKKVRYETIKMYGSSCMCCGSEHRIVVDHIKPRSRFPELELDLNNLQVLCNDCNMGKSNDDYTDFRPMNYTVEEALDLAHLTETEHLH